MKVEDGGYRLTKRGSKGVTTLNITEKTGKVIAMKCVVGDEDLMIINKSGIAIRFAIADAGSEKGRNTQGVKLIDLKKRNESIASVCVVPHEDVEDEDEDPSTNSGQDDNDNENNNQ
jgi:DNA gyrase subunit A